MQPSPYMAQFHQESNSSFQPYVFINKAIDIAELVKELFELSVDPPSLFLDIEGVNLSRHGSISILQVFVLPHNKTYLIDVHTLKENASLQAASNGQTLKDLLESKSIPKVFVDVRNDSDALYSHFGISLTGIQDLQLMELATRSFPKRCVNGLARCIENKADMTFSERNTWKLGKEKGLNLFAPERGGSYEVFNLRPLAQDNMQLWQKYNRKLSPRWAAKIEAEVKNRILISKSATYNGKGRHMALATKGW
ncbi:uncharacterized protein BDW43DRAFT_304292 [Aspergillus alliaceus]|uniref:uncharacterized protein n=1 Tax=Petromyces alliaceus TaxID=209559 RepID=UPI0012A3B363|nr:ribonuclease H-like domain-containing protein [Aspergillus alliaceus]KAB8227913.1 ribonuclease H-like domain-containing protein [Aspergillus alliaceus]